MAAELTFNLYIVPTYETFSVVVVAIAATVSEYMLIQKHLIE